MFNELYIKMAIDLARKSKGGPFGAVIVKDDILIGRGSNQVVELHDPTAHAEIMAIREACDKLRTTSLTEAILYASSEPCPMCMSAIYWAGIKRVYYGATRVSAANIGFMDYKLYYELRKDPMTRDIPTYDCGQYWMMVADSVMQQWDGTKY